MAGALDSAWRCVYEILVQEQSPKLASSLERYGENENAKNANESRRTKDNPNSKAGGYHRTMAYDQDRPEPPRNFVAKL